MNLIQEFSQKHLKKNIPEIRSGDFVRVHLKVQEGNKERVQIFEGIVIKVHAGKSLNATFTVRKVSFGVGIERTFPLHSPTIVKVEKTKSIKVRRAKLYFLRDLVGKKAKKRQEFKEFMAWEEPEAEKELAKIEEEKAKEAEAKEEEKKKEEEELEKKFTQAQVAKKSN